MTGCDCGTCSACRMRLWRSDPANRERERALERERRRKKRAAAPDETRAADRAYYAANRERIQARRRAGQTDEQREKARERTRRLRSDPAYREAERARDRARKKHQRGSND